MGLENGVEAFKFVASRDAPVDSMLSDRCNCGGKLVYDELGAVYPVCTNPSCPHKSRDAETDMKFFKLVA